MPDVSQMIGNPVRARRAAAIRTAREPDNLVGLVSWLDPTAGRTVDGSNRVTSWVDLITGGDYANSAGDTTNPTLGTAVNGIQPVNFASANSQFLDMDDGASGIGLQAAPATFMAVINPTNLHNGYYWSYSPIGAYAQNYVWSQAIRSTGVVRQQTVNNFTTTADTTSPRVVSAAAWNLIFVQMLGPVAGAAPQYSSGNIEFDVNGNTQSVAGSYYASFLHTINRASLGCYRTDPADAHVSFFNGDVAEICLFNRILKSSEIAGLKAYVNLKYNQSFT